MSTPPPAPEPAAIRAMVTLLEPAVRYHRYRLEGLDRLPEGPALLVGNHSGGGAPVDLLILHSWYKRRGSDDPLHVLAHDFFFDRMGLEGHLNKLGVLRASRATAIAALEAGRKVLVFPGTDYDALRPFRARREVRLAGHKGFAKLAVRAGVPVVPVANVGGHEGFVVLRQGLRAARALRIPKLLRWHSFPLVLCLPWGLAVGPMAYLPYVPLPTKIAVEIGAPIHPSGGEDAVDRLYARTEQALQALVRAGYARRGLPVLG